MDRCGLDDDTGDRGLLVLLSDADSADEAFVGRSDASHLRIADGST